MTAKISDLSQATALRQALQRLREAGWAVNKPQRLDGTAGGPSLYLCHVEKRALIVVGLVKEAFGELKRFAQENKVAFQTAVFALGQLLDEAAAAYPALSDDLRGLLSIAAGLYIHGTRCYEMTSTNGDVQYIIIRYVDVSTGRSLLRPCALLSGNVLTPAEVEQSVNDVLQHDRQVHPERFARAKVIPFRLKKN